MMKKTNDGFRDHFRFLSNFETLETKLQDKHFKGIYYPTVEHYYQASKFTSEDIRERISSHPNVGLKKFVKGLMKSNRLVQFWDQRKLEVMEEGLMFKFDKSYNPSLCQMLIDTRDTQLVEYNHWGDKYWGVCSKLNVGDNNLGKLLMGIRSIKQESMNEVP